MDQQIDRRIFFLVTRAARVLLKTSDRYLKGYVGITTVQMGALFYLMQNDGCLLKELSKGLELNNSAVTGLVDRMAANGFVRRAPCQKDGRAFRIFITKKGRKTAEKGIPLALKMNQEIAGAFTDSEIEVVVRFLNAIIHETENRLEGI